MSEFLSRKNQRTVATLRAESVGKPVRVRSLAALLLKCHQQPPLELVVDNRPEEAECPTEPSSIADRQTTPTR